MIRLLAAFFLTVSLTVFAEPHGGGDKGTKPVPAAKKLPPAGPDCVERASGDFSADLELGKRDVFLEATTFFAKKKSKFTPAMVADWEEISWPDQFRKSAKLATEGRRQFRRQTIDQVKALADRARSNRVEKESSDKDKFALTTPSAEGSDSLRSWVRSTKSQVGGWLKSSRYREVVERIQLLPEVMERRQAIEKQNVELTAQREGLRTIVSDARSKHFDELMQAEKARGTPFEKIDQSLLNKQADELVEGSAAETIREIEERTNLIDANSSELDFALGRYAESAGHWVDFSAVPPRQVARRLSSAGQAIRKHLAENKEDLNTVKRIAEIAEVHRALDALKDSGNLGEEEERAESEGKALSKEYESLAKVFAKGATVGVGFAIGLSREPNGSLYPSVIVPVLGKPRLQGLGVPVRLFEIAEDASKNEINRLAKGVLANVLEDGFVAAPGVVTCVEGR